MSELLRAALQEMRGHQLRTILTLLGVILGTLAIVVLTSLQGGVVAAVWSDIADLGFDGVVRVARREPADAREAMRFARSRGLVPEDAAFVARRGRGIAAVAAVGSTRAMVRSAGIEREAQVLGVTPSYAAVRNRAVAAGRFFDQRDERTFARVCIPGHRLAARLFGGDDPIGRIVRIGARPFRVIGVGRPLGNRFVEDGDFIEEMEGILVPLATLRTLFTGAVPLDRLEIKAADTGDLEALEAEVLASLRLAHRGADDFEVLNLAEEILLGRREAGAQIRAWSIVLGSIAGLSLLVGGIGLVSVMLIAVGERLQEIGLRKAVGATDGRIFLQFVAESAFLAVIGGILGAGSGVAVTAACARFFSQGLPLSPGGLLAAIGIAALVGILAGIHPALKAARLTPVEAMRAG